MPDRLNNMKIILGSSSKWRKIILEKAGYSFEVMIPGIDEKAIRSENYQELPLLIARAKAEAILPRIIEPSILITSDQVVVCEGELREKPKDEKEARRFLKSYSEGKVGQTNTSVVITNTGNGKRAEEVDIAKVYFREIPDQVIDEYIKDNDVFTCAGGFVIDHPLLSPYIDRVEGERDSAEGLPMKVVNRLLKEVQ